MATNNSVNVGLAGAIGTVKFAGTTSPTFITPVLGAATATSLAFSPTTGGIIGTKAADNPTAGDVGEVISSAVLSSPGVSVTTSVAKNITSITLSAGDWDVWANGGISATVITSSAVWTSSTSASVPDASLYSYSAPSGVSSSIQNAPSARYNVSGSTIVYLSMYAVFTGTGTGYGNILARRRR